MAEKIGLYGGTFDPPHIGHLITAQSLAEQLGLSKILFLPSGRPPHKLNRSITPANHRLNMLQLAVADHPWFQIDDWELRQDGSNYTFNSVCHYLQIYAHENLYWLIGADSLADLPNWYRSSELIDTVNIATAWRGGIDIDRVLADLQSQLPPNHYEKLRRYVVRTPMIEIAANDIRDRVARGLPIRYMVPADVERYIFREGLYR